MKRITLWMLTFFLMFMAGGCSKKLSPEDSFSMYLESWEEMNFAEMYQHLSGNAKERMSEQQFVERYEKIYNGIEVKQLKITGRYTDTEETKGGAITLKYTVRMTTNAGPIEFDHQAQLVKEKSNEKQQWFVNWEPSLIFPTMEEGDTVGVRTLKATRGEIYDRHGSGLAINAPAYVVGIVPEKLSDQEETSIEALADLLAITPDEIKQKLSADWVKPELFVPIVTLPYGQKDIEPFLKIPGVMIQEETVRTYPFGPATAHLIGYVREISAEQLQELEKQGYSAGDIIGNTGLESIYENKLRGKNGVHIYIRDKDGNLKETLAQTDAVDGETLQLALDANLQYEIYQQLEGDAGTSVAVAPKTGALLALVSTPAFDPNAFVRGLSTKQWEEWNQNPKNPFFNRFLNRSAPGSVFKTITAAAGLKLGTIEPNERKQINGLRWSKDESWGGYYVTRVKNKSTVNLRDAIVYSDNIYFAQEAIELGIERFVNAITEFGFNEELNLPFTMAPSQLSNAGINTEVQLADSAYGQGEILMSPIHLAMTYTPFLNDGDMLYPLLLKEEERKIWKNNLIDHETVERIDSYLLDVVKDPNGTGHGVYIPTRTIAGKSGTAEIKASKSDTQGTENGWFVAYDHDKQDLLIAMMIEDVKQRGGSSYVGKKVKPIFQLLP
ncbi:hypothetical protein CHH80_18285 [Bacillus sp. 7504-2]|nr:hypothetical protein CHH80_18285 [Bacillus sp. 7504-2]